MVVGRHIAMGGVLAQSLSGEEATRRVTLVAGALALLGLIVLVGTVWWWRSTRAEHPALGPLEVMSERRWRRAGEAQRTRLIEEVRPNAADRAPGFVPEPVDLSVLAQGDHAGFDDLREIDVMLGLHVPGSLALRTEPDPEPPADGTVVSDADLVDGEGVADVVDGEAGGDQTVAIDGGDVASLLAREDAGIDPLLQRAANPD